MANSRTIAVVTTTIVSVLSRLASLASQIIVGLFLTDDEIGTFAVALGITGLTGLLRTGGIAQVLAGMQKPELEKQASACLSWAITFTFLAVALTLGVAGAAPALSGVLDNLGLPGLASVLCVMAMRQALVPFSVLARARLSVERRFVTIAKVDAVNALGRVAITLLIATRGGGTMALVVPYLAQIVVDAAVLGALGGLRRSDLRPNRGEVWALRKTLFWPIAIAALASTRTDIIYLVLGITIPAAALGIFYFAYQLANQPTMLLASALQNVLAPYQADDRGNQAAERKGLELVLAGAMLFVPVTTIATASLFPSLELLVWGGRWAGAYDCLLFLSIGSTYATVSALLTGPLLGLRRFKALTMFEGTRIMGTVGGGAIGAIVVMIGDERFASGSTEASIIGASVGLSMAIVAIGQLVWVMRTAGTDWNEIIRNMIFGPTLAVLTALAAQSIGHSIRESLDMPAGRLGAAIEFLSVTTVYVGLITLAIRFTAEPTLRETIGAMPAPTARLLKRLLVLR